MASRQTLLLYTSDIKGAANEINVRAGAITICLTDSVFVASLPSSFNTNLLTKSKLTPPNSLDEESTKMVAIWQVVKDKDLLRSILKRRISLARRGVAAVAAVMETDISSSTFPLVLAGAHSLAETFAGEPKIADRLTFVFKQYLVESTVIPGSGPPNVPLQPSSPGALRVPSIHVSSWPSTVPFNNKLYCLYRGRNANASSLFYNEYNGSSWTGEQQVSDVVMFEGPSGVAFNNKLYCFMQGNNHHTWFSTFDGNKWDKAELVKDTRITSGPSAVVFNNKIYCIHQGWINPANALWFNVFDGKTWAGDKNVSGSSITGSPSAVVFNNLIYCFYQGAGAYEKVLMYSVLSPAAGVWSEQKPVPNAKRMSQGPSAIVVDDKLYCLHQDESEGHLYANVTSDGVEWGEDRLIDDVNMCEGLATAHFNKELYYFFQKGEGGKTTDGELWYRKLKLAEGGSSTNPDWAISQGEPSLEALGFPGGYKGFIKLATDMQLHPGSALPATFGYVIYITKLPLLYESYADGTRMCLHYAEPSYIHYSFAKMFSAEGTFDQRLFNSNANFPPSIVSAEEPSYTLGWVPDWKTVLENAQLLVFHRADDTKKNPHLWVLLLDKRNSRWVEMEGPKMSYRAVAVSGAPSPQFGPGSRIYVFYHADSVTLQEMRYNVLGISNEDGEKIWDVEKVMHSIQGSNTPSAVFVGKYMHVFHAGASGGRDLRYTSLDTRFNHWAEDRDSFDIFAGTSPSAVLYMDRIYVFNKGFGAHNNGKLAVSIWDKEKLTWEQSTNLNANSTHTLAGEPTAVVCTDYVYAFYVFGTSLWWNQFNGATWRGPTQVQMAYSNVQPLAQGFGAYVWGDKIHCFFRGGKISSQDGKLVFYKVFNTADFTWNDEVILPTASGFSGKPGVILNHLIIGS